MPRASCRGSCPRTSRNSRRARRTLAGLHNPQGRVIAMLALLRTAPDEVLAVLPRELMRHRSNNDCANTCCARRCAIEDIEQIVTRARIGSGDPDAGLPSHCRGAADGCCWCRTERPANSSRAPKRTSNGNARDIAAGLPQVYPATSETFVAQMLNLDLLGAHLFRQGLLHGPGSHRARSLPRPRETPPAALAWHAGSMCRAPATRCAARDGRALTVVRVAPRRESRG